MNIADSRKVLHLRIDPELHESLRRYAFEKRLYMNEAAQELMKAALAVKGESR